VDRVLGGVLVGLAALILAVLECLYVNLRIGRTPVPLAQIVAMLGNLGLPWAMSKLTGRRGTALIPALLWGVIAVVFAASGPGGDVVVPGNWQGIFLLLGGAGAAVLSIVVLVQPAGRARRTSAPQPQSEGRSVPARSQPAKSQPAKSQPRRSRPQPRK
jgi:hypothetical protein